MADRTDGATIAAVARRASVGNEDRRSSNAKIIFLFPVHGKDVIHFAVHFEVFLMSQKDLFTLQKCLAILQ